VRFTRRYGARPDVVWRALTEPESLRRWLDPRGEITTNVRTIEPERVLELDWDVSGDRSIVRFELAVDGDQTVLVLDHRLLDERVGMTYMRLWDGALARLDEELGR
jgi:uncharacterized protein YndB with AHSA1/START domain